MRWTACDSFNWPHPTRHIQDCRSGHYHHFFRLRLFLSYLGRPFHDRKHRVMSHSESEDLACLLLVPEGKIFDITHWYQPLRGAWLDLLCYIDKCLWPLILCEVQCFISFSLIQELIQHICELFSRELCFMVGVLRVLGISWTREAKEVWEWGILL